VKVGDLVKNIKPYTTQVMGVIVATAGASLYFNKSYEVLWEDGSTQTWWDYDLELICEAG
jgi:hypothetical protein